MMMIMSSLNPVSCQGKILFLSISHTHTHTHPSFGAVKWWRQTMDGHVIAAFERSSATIMLTRAARPLRHLTASVPCYSATPLGI